VRGNLDREVFLPIRSPKEQPRGIELGPKRRQLA
jgi:hypothetical protein